MWKHFRDYLNINWLEFFLLLQELFFNRIDIGWKWTSLNQLKLKTRREQNRTSKLVQGMRLKLIPHLNQVRRKPLHNRRGSQLVSDGSKYFKNNIKTRISSFGFSFAYSWFLLDTGWMLWYVESCNTMLLHRTTNIHYSLLSLLCNQ